MKTVKIKKIFSFFLAFVMILAVSAQPMMFALNSNDDVEFLSDTQRAALEEMLKNDRKSGLLGFDGQYSYDKDSEEKVSVIVEFVNRPAKLAQILLEYSGARTPYRNLENEALNDHYEFRDELDKIFGAAAYSKSDKQNAPYEITAEYYDAINGVAMTVSAAKLDEIVNMDCVHAVYPDAVTKMFSDTTSASSSTEEIGMYNSREYLNIEALHNAGITGEGITVGVIDTGVDYNHPDLKNSFAIGEDGKPFYGRNFVREPLLDNISYRGDFDPMETTYEEWSAIPGSKPALNDPIMGEFYTSHGTHVAGTVLAKPNSEGSYSTKGLAYDATLISYRVLGPYGSGNSSFTISALDKIYEDGCDVVNLSLGVEIEDPYFITSIAINNLIIQYDIVFAIAAGNSGYSDDIGGAVMKSLGAPGTSSLAITVGNGTVTNYNSVIVASTSSSAITTSPSAISVDNVEENEDGEDMDSPINEIKLNYLYNHWDNKAVQGSDGIYRLTYPELKYNEQKGYKLVSTKPISSDGEDELLPPIGIGAKGEFTEEVIREIKGNILVVYRGNVLLETVETAIEYGAGGVIVISDDDWNYWQIKEFRGYGLDYLPMFTISNEDATVNSTLLEDLKEGKEVFLSFEALESLEGGALNETSSRGPVHETMELKPDVVAPGTEIISTIPYFAADYTLDKTNPDRYDYSYGSMTGTSMASPHIAGIVALMLQYSEDTYGEKWSAQEIKSRLQNTANHMQPKTEGNSYSIFEIGGGYVDPVKAMHSELTVKVPYMVAVLDKNGEHSNTSYEKYTFVEKEISSLNYGFTRIAKEMDKNLEFTLKSHSDIEKTYNITTEFDKGYNDYVGDPSLYEGQIKIEVNESTVTLEPGSEVKLSANMFIADTIEEIYSDFISFGGRIILTNTENNSEVYTIPFASGIEKDPEFLSLAALERSVIGAVDPETGEDNRQIKEEIYGVTSYYSDFLFGIGNKGDELFFIVADENNESLGELGVKYDISFLDARDVTEYGAYRITSLMKGKYYPYDSNGTSLKEEIEFEPGLYNIIACVVKDGELVERSAVNFYVDADKPEIAFDRADGSTVAYSADTATIEGYVSDEGMQYLNNIGAPYGLWTTSIMYKIGDSDVYYETEYPDYSGKFSFDIPKEYIGEDIEITFYVIDAYTLSSVSSFGGKIETNPMVPCNRELYDIVTMAEFGANLNTYTFSFVYQE